jgi:hypothetical protein
MDATTRAPTLLIIESDLPEGLTLAAYRTRRGRGRRRRAHLRALARLALGIGHG